MAHMTWNSFVGKHKSSTCFGAGVSAKLPKGPHFDRNKKKLPTPYGLFQEWLSVSLTGDWTTTKVHGGFAVCVANPTDAALISKTFGTTGSTVRTPISSQTHQLLYRDSSYADLAKTMGYAI